MGKLLSVVFLVAVVGVVGVLTIRRPSLPPEPVAQAPTQQIEPGFRQAPLLIDVLTSPEEQAVRSLLQRKWPTAPTITNLQTRVVWSQGDARVVHAIFDAQNISGAHVREKELISFRIDAAGELIYHSRWWTMTTDADISGQDLDDALHANQFGKYDGNAIELGQAATKHTDDKRVVGTETIRGVRYNIHDDGTKTVATKDAQ